VEEFRLDEGGTEIGNEDRKVLQRECERLSFRGGIGRLNCSGKIKFFEPRRGTVELNKLNQKTTQRNGTDMYTLPTCPPRPRSCSSFRPIIHMLPRTEEESIRPSARPVLDPRRCGMRREQDKNNLPFLLCFAPESIQQRCGAVEVVGQRWLRVAAYFHISLLLCASV
jgi:hypothetical protein